MRKILFIILFLLLCVTVISAQDIDIEVKNKILKQLKNLKNAHLKNDTNLADEIYDEKLILTSQSGKRYEKKDALANIKNKFGFYENSDIKFLPLSKKIVITNYINERKIADFNQEKYRITAVWIKHKKNWKIISLQSSKVINREK